MHAPSVRRHISADLNRNRFTYRCITLLFFNVINNSQFCVTEAQCHKFDTSKKADLWSGRKCGHRFDKSTFTTHLRTAQPYVPPDGAKPYTLAPTKPSAFASTEDASLGGCIKC